MAKFKVQSIIVGTAGLTAHAHVRIPPRGAQKVRELECWHAMSLSHDQLDKAKQPIEFLSSEPTGSEQSSSRNGGGSLGDVLGPGREPSRLSQQTSLADVKKEKGRF